MKIIAATILISTLAVSATGPAAAQGNYIIGGTIPPWQNVPSGMATPQPYVPNVYTPAVPAPQIMRPDGLGGYSNYNGSLQIQPVPGGGYWGR